MAIYQYGNIKVPEIPASELPYVLICKNAVVWRVCFSSEPFVALENMTGVHISILGHSGYYTAAHVTERAQLEMYEFYEEDNRGWVRVQHDGNGLIGESGVRGGEIGVFHYYCGAIQSPSTTWCNEDIYYKGTTLALAASTDPVLFKESFPIQEFTTYLMTAWQMTKSLPFPESGGES